MKLVKMETWKVRLGDTRQVDNDEGKDKDEDDE